MRSPNILFKFLKLHICCCTDVRFFTCSIQPNQENFPQIPSETAHSWAKFCLRKREPLCPSPSWQPAWCREGQTCMLCTGIAFTAWKFMLQHHMKAGRHVHFEQFFCIKYIRWLFLLFFCYYFYTYIPDNGFQVKFEIFSIIFSGRWQKWQSDS